MKTPRAPEAPRRAVSFLLVLLAHAALIGAAIYKSSRTRIEPRSVTLEAFSMELSFVPLAPAAAPTEVPPGPPLLEQMHLKQEIESPPVPKLELFQNLDEAAALNPPPMQETTTPDTSGAGQTTAPPSVSAASDTRYAAQQTSAGSSSDAMVSWQSMLLGHLEKYKRYPLRAERQKQEGVVYVRFSVDRQGNVHDGRLGKSSGFPALDDETLAVVRRANPVPPPPPEIAGDPVEVMVPVSFYLRKG